MCEKNRIWLARISQYVCHWFYTHRFAYQHLRRGSGKRALLSSLNDMGDAIRYTDHFSVKIQKLFLERDVTKRR